jgi:hypothetical protein
MRVSLETNALVSDYLYHSYSPGAPKGPSSKLPRLPQDFDRKSPDPGTHLQHLEMIDWHCHSRDECCFSTYKVHPIHVSLLKVSSSPSEYAMLRSPKKCMCLINMLPRRLVVEAYTLQNMAADLPVCPNLTNIVIYTGNPFCNYTGLNCMNRRVLKRLFSKAPTTPRAVFISTLDYRQIHWEHMAKAREDWKRFRCELIRTATAVDIPREIVLVNLEDLATDWWSRSRSKDMSLVDAANVAFGKTYTHSLNKLVTNPRDSKTVIPKNAKLVKFKFISMETYLASYDWKDVIHEQVAKRWLDQNKAE